ncbi:cardiolipin synthase [Alicyclobacillus tolerans]|uniref:Cardiolipin synthase n=1 Tax=Alicyclobacillus tolerans TaxID=90970 RepID=A0ABT9LUD0_9BACL|nr:cardiolipin synthase [Alicyclobacillus tengchongensis]MDP9727867.1 cardiolipin synthase [Alicyclobacillus tengchongensis]
MMLIHLLYIVTFSIDLVTAGVIIFLERRDAAVTWAWLMVLLFVPIGGFLLYLLLGKKLNGVKMYRIRRMQREFVNAIVEAQKTNLREGNIEFYDPFVQRYQDLIYMNLVSSYAVFTQDNRVEVFYDGQSKFISLLDTIRQAKHHIHLEYYIFRPDRLGRQLVSALIQKANEGVEVRVLYDAVGSKGLHMDFFGDLIHAGGYVARFFPSIFPFFNPRMNHRNHRKLAIIDGRVGYIGGFNIGDEYLGRDVRFGAWRDTHLKIEGTSVLEMQALFLMDWNFASKKRLRVTDDYFPLQPDTGDVGVQIVSSGPNSRSETIRNAYVKMIYLAKRQILIQSPYFIPDESLLTALKTAALSGVDVRIMLPDKPDHYLVYFASRFYLAELLEVGVKFYLYKNGFLHAKTVVIDSELASVGTANLDIRSFKLNFEVNAVLYDSRIACRLAELFYTDIEKSSELTRELYQKRPHAVRIAESCARLLSPIL